MTTLAEVFDSLKYRIVDDSGTRRYFNHAGQLHRDVGPAVEYASGTKEWWHHGVKHRNCGPAVIRSDGSNEWWLNGVYYTKHGYLMAGGTP